jgi:hypothetical protein
VNKNPATYKPIEPPSKGTGYRRAWNLALERAKQHFRDGAYSIDATLDPQEIAEAIDTLIVEE